MGQAQRERAVRSDSTRNRDAILEAASECLIELLSTESVESIPGWLERHEDELADVTTHELDIIDGAHYLHWTQSRLMARTISEFVTANVTR